MKKQFWSSATSLILQAVTIISGLILPRMMIKAFGSESYGLVNSLTQFLSYVALFEGGIGAVVRAALYKKFANNDNLGVSRILKATQSFYRKLSLGFVAYAVVLLLIYPTFINDTFDYIYTGSMLLIILASQIAQYCFGVTYGILLQADNKLYVSNIAGIIYTILNLAISILLINLGASIHIVKLISACVYLIRPAIFQVYVKRKYNLVKDCTPDYTDLGQRKYAFAHHIAYFLHTNTDTVIITIFSTLTNVSIYSVYYLVASCMTKIVNAVFSGAEALFGNYTAQKGEKAAAKKFDYYTMSINSVIIVMFFTAGCMLLPFVRLYTSGINDADYIVPALGFSLLFAEMMYNFRLPYANMITIEGHFKQTQVAAAMEAALNIGLSIILINVIGIPGVAIATAIAMSYRTLYNIWYLSRNILKFSLIKNLVRMLAAITIICIGVALKNIFINNLCQNYFVWAANALVYVFVGIIMACIYDLLFFRKCFLRTLTMVKNRIVRTN